MEVPRCPNLRHKGSKVVRDGWEGNRLIDVSGGDPVREPVYSPEATRASQRPHDDPKHHYSLLS